MAYTDSQALFSSKPVSRVALARAVYSPAKYVLLDDPLSAVVCQLDKGAGTASDNRT